MKGKLLERASTRCAVIGLIIVLLCSACDPTEETTDGTAFAIAIEASDIQTAAPPTPMSVPSPTSTPMAKPTIPPPPSNTPSPTPPSPETLLEEAFSALEMAGSYRRVEESTMAVSYADNNVEIVSTVNLQLQGADRIHTVSSTALNGETTFAESIWITDTLYIKEMESEEWLVSDEPRLVSIIDSAGLLQPGIIEQLTMVGQEIIEGQQAFHLQGMVTDLAGQLPAEIFDTMPSLRVEADLVVDYWIGTEDGRFITIRVAGETTSTASPGDEGEFKELSQAIDVTYRFSEYDDPVRIEAPEVARAPEITEVPDISLTDPTPYLVEFSDGPEIYLAADGSGDYPDLVSAVEAAEAGTTIYLEVGTYPLDKQGGYIDIYDSLRLVGSGMQETEIVSSSHEWVVAFVGSGTFAAEGISFKNLGEYQEAESASALFIGGGTVVIDGCEFVGAAASSDTKQENVGLKLVGNTEGLVQRSTATDNDIGFLLGGSSQVLLENNVCSDNLFFGIVYMRESGGAARGNVCTRNGADGILLLDQSRPVLEGNISVENQESGIAYRDESGGEARGNQCSRNGRDGIFVAEQAFLTLEGNTCIENAGAGISFWRQSGGIAARNECSRNDQDGIYLDDQAHPALLENSCTENGGAGIVFLGESEGVTMGNECSENYVGIFAGELARPTLGDNTCLNNEMFGISFIEESGGEAHGNKCSGNLVGIWVDASATPVLSDNDCHDNIEADIVDNRP